MRGTPSTLKQALENGLNDFWKKKFNIDKAPVDEEAIEFLRAAVQDFVAQKFQVAKIMAHQGRFKTEKDLQILFDACVKTRTTMDLTEAEWSTT